MNFNEQLGRYVLDDTEAEIRLRIEALRRESEENAIIRASALNMLELDLAHHLRQDIEGRTAIARDKTIDKQREELAVLEVTTRDLRMACHSFQEANTTLTTTTTHLVHWATRVIGAFEKGQVSASLLLEGQVILMQQGVLRPKGDKEWMDRLAAWLRAGHAPTDFEKNDAVVAARHAFDRAGLKSPQGPVIVERLDRVWDAEGRPEEGCIGYGLSTAGGLTCAIPWFSQEDVSGPENFWGPSNRGLVVAEAKRLTEESYRDYLTAYLNAGTQDDRNKLKCEFYALEHMRRERALEEDGLIAKLKTLGQGNTEQQTHPFVGFGPKDAEVLPDALANAPIDDEPLTESEAAAVDHARSLGFGRGNTLDEVEQELGFDPNRVVQFIDEPGDAPEDQ